MADMKTAAYICKGCGIGERVNTAQMAKIATKEGKMNLVREHDFLCNAAGVQMIRDDIEKEGVTHVMIAACSRRAKTEAFQFPTVALARANIREGVIWSQPDTPEAKETTQEMADDYVRMGCAEVKKMKLPAGNPSVGHNKRMLVVGGGVSGMTAALEAAKTGYEVVLVEKEKQLGGWAAKLHKRVAYREPYRDPADTGIDEMIAAVNADPKCIKVYLAFDRRRDQRRAGAVQRPHRNRVEAAPRREEVGAIVQASGFSLYDANKLPEFGYGKSRQHGRPGRAGKSSRRKPRRKAADPPPVRRRRSEVRRVRAMRRPARQHRQAPALLLRLLLQHQHQAGDVFQGRQSRYRHGGDLHGSAHARQRRGFLPQRADERRHLHQGQGDARSNRAGNTCTVKFRDLILDEDTAIADVDLVVLATGQVPNSGVDIDAKLNAEIAAAAGNNALLSYNKSQAAGAVKPISILNLDLPPGPGPAAVEARLHRFAFHLLSVRDPPHRHLRRRPGAPPDGHRAGG